MARWARSAYLANGDKAFPKERVEVFCGGRVAVLDDFRRLELVANGKRQVRSSRLRQDKGHPGEWEAFAWPAYAGGPPPIPYEQLFGVTRATFAAVEACAAGQRDHSRPHRQRIPVNLRQASAKTGCAFDAAPERELGH